MVSEPGLDLDLLIAEGVYDPAAPRADERLALLEHLRAAGASTEQIIAAAKENQLASVGADQVMFDIGEATTIAELAGRIGTPIEKVMRIRLAGGFPAEPSSTVPEWVADDVAGFNLAAGTFGEPALLAFTRVMGSAASRIAEAGLALFLSEVESGLGEPGVTELDRAMAVEQATGLLDVISVIVRHLLREHLMMAVRRQRATEQSGPIAAGALIGFVDLVASTEWAAGRTLRAQAEAIGLFESAAWEIATRRRGRIVKLIGDEVMYTSSDPVDACLIALELCSAVEAEPSLPAARGAVGLGDVYYRDGDFYGQPVHLVARAVKAASPGSVVVTAELAAACQQIDAVDVVFASLGDHWMRGIDAPVPLFRVTEALAL
ncbi:MAG TPA: adenylate cyclase regulatory domain-containing protein [Acidimicrobiales bacterium]|nr:adenylate cyclase regulatory domain-containing protein [Acidimicrobiales bacterium]